jgi:hypothetical protein
MGSRLSPSALFTNPEVYSPGVCASHCQQPHHAQPGPELEQLTPADVQALQTLEQGPAPSEIPPLM